MSAHIPSAPTPPASSGLTLDMLTGSAATWVVRVLVIPAAISGFYWGISSLIEANRLARDQPAAFEALRRDMERIDRAAAAQVAEAFKAIEATAKRGQERREALERDIRERNTGVDARFTALEANLANLTGGVIELRTEQRSIKAGVDRIEGAVQGLSARPSATAAIPVLPTQAMSPEPAARAAPSVRGWTTR